MPISMLDEEGSSIWQVGSHVIIIIGHVTIIFGY